MIIYTVIGILVFFIIGLDFVFRRCLFIGLFFIISVCIITVFYKGLDACKSCIGTEGCLVITCHADITVGSGFLCRTFKGCHILGGIIGKALCFRCVNQRFVLLDGFQCQGAEVILPGHGITVILLCKILGGIQSHVGKIAAVGVQIIVLCQVVVVVKLYPGNVVSAYRKVCGMYCRVGFHGNHGKCDYNGCGNHNAYYFFCLSLLFGSFGFFFSFLYLFIVPGHHLFG